MSKKNKFGIEHLSLGDHMSLLLRIIMVAALSTVFITNAQANSKGKTEFATGNIGLRGYSMVGGGQLNFDKLNEKLEAKDYEGFSKEVLILGGGFHASFRRFIIGFQGNAFLTDDKSSFNGNTATELQGGSGFVNLGYTIISRRNVSIYPLVGFGGGMSELSMFPKDAPNFDDILTDPGIMVKLTSSAFLVNLAIGCDYLLIMGKNRQGAGGFSLGIRAGYIYSPFRKNWHYKGLPVGGGPKLDMSGPYVTLLIGGGGIFTEK